ncbi:GDSL-type esterase/lipase family protein [uncultured Sunxiuqinia sp.]|uniref:SGNH/GDSL hydrolase family protein n=1 Tax=uncultured Sunxiuqinia sp. TaxID=1573825 RepID=UPI0030DBC723
MKSWMAVLLVLNLQILACFGQSSKTAWDNTINKNWPDGFTHVEIESKADGKMQQAVFYKTTLEKQQPLIVSLHTWSGDYLQEDPLAGEVELHNWNYIHPDFRGPNNNPEACGGELVLADIEDAIGFAIQQGNVDTSEVHIIGVSGGGYATMLAFMKIRFPVKSFSAWAGISNLNDWYYESVGRQLRYARDLEGVTTGSAGFDAAEARKRSPIFMDFQPELRKNATLRIYTGIHDGCAGSVPITQSINMFNKLLPEIYPDKKGESVSDSLKLVLLEKRMNPGGIEGILGGRKIHLQRWLPNLSLTVFEGGHEMLVPQALALLQVGEENHMQPLNILTIGDSNGAAENGWPAQLGKLLPFSTIVNKSISGNTIGFDNLDNPKLNTLRNVEDYLDSAFCILEAGQQLDYIIFGLGTNDAKQVFDSKINEVSKNLDSLLTMTIQYLKKKNKVIPHLVILTPPPMNEKIANTEKYGGGNSRIIRNNKPFSRVAQKQGASFIDSYSPLSESTSEITTDGVHLTTRAQFETAGMIVNFFMER